MSMLALCAGIVVALALGLLRILAIDEAKGRLQRRVRASVEATIASLPSELADAWGDEWRAELEAVWATPITAVLFARGVRRSARQLAKAQSLAPAGVDGVSGTHAPKRPGEQLRSRSRAIKGWMLGVWRRGLGGEELGDDVIFAGLVVRAVGAFGAFGYEMVSNPYDEASWSGLLAMVVGAAAGFCLGVVVGFMRNLLRRRK